MTDVGSLDTEGTSKLNRRDFLKLLGLVVGGATLTAGGVKLADEYEEIQQNPRLTGKEVPKDWIEGKLPLGKLNIVDNPDYWVGESGDELRKKLSNTLCTEYAKIYPELRQYARDKEGYDTGEWPDNKMRGVFDKLTIDLASRGEDVVLAKTKEFDYIQKDLNYRYYEMASYVQALASLLDYKDKVGAEKFSDEMYKLVISQETLGSIGNTQVEQVINRRKIDSLWNYDWPALGKGLTTSPPIVAFLFFPDGYELNSKPYGFDPDRRLSADGLKPPINPSNEWYTKRPKKVEILNFDPEVEELVRKELKSVGIERGINSITIANSDHLSGKTRATPDESTVTFFYPQPETLHINEYHAREREILKIALHEGYHSLSFRRTYLSTVDRMKLRNIEQEILKMADPLSDLQKVFNPEGDDHGFIEDNEHSITRYYLENVLNIYGNMGLGTKDVLNEFRYVITGLTGEDIFSTLWVYEDDKDMDGLFDRLDKNISNYKGTTKFFAQTLLDNREAILSRKRIAYPKLYDAAYFNDIVMPLVFTHLIMYKFEEFANNVLPENLEQDRGLSENYMNTLYKRVRSFVKSEPSEEFLADLFSESMLVKKYGNHDVSYVNEVKNKFDDMVGLLRKNKLVASSNLT